MQAANDSGWRDHGASCSERGLANFMPSLRGDFELWKRSVRVEVKLDVKSGPIEPEGHLQMWKRRA
jgi:hypothetical protein